MIMVRFARVLTCLAAAGALSACVTVPPGPSQASLPGSGKAWDQFQADDASCREIAAARGGVPNDAAAQAGAGSAVAGTVSAPRSAGCSVAVRAPRSAPAWGSSPAVSSARAMRRTPLW